MGNKALPWVLVLVAIAVAIYLWWQSTLSDVGASVGTQGLIGGGQVPPGGLPIGSDVPVTTPTIAQIVHGGGFAPSGQGTAPPGSPPPAAGSLLKLPQAKIGNTTPANVSLANAAAFEKKQADAAAAKKAQGGGLFSFSNFGY